MKRNVGNVFYLSLEWEHEWQSTGSDGLHRRKQDPVSYTGGNSKSMHGLMRSLVLCSLFFSLRLRLRRHLFLRRPRRAIIAELQRNTNVFRYRNTSPSPLAPFAVSCLPTTRTAPAVALPRSSSLSPTLLPRLRRSSTVSSSMVVP